MTPTTAVKAVTAADYDALVKRIVDQAPPFSPETKAALRVLLRRAS